MTAEMEARVAQRKQEQARGRVVVEARRRRVRAPFSLRCGALLVDYTLAVSISAFATLLARTLGGSISLTGEATLGIGYLLSLGALLLNFLVLPVFTGTTVGKWATGLRIERHSGEPLGFGHATLRHTLGYLVSLLTFGFGFLLAAFDAEGRALHDRIAGTVVVRDLGGERPRMR
ncbi:MAG: RDD family protein [Acidobacteria bacterium]|nr:RDD family protein [Acidobacteriota bacterium]